MKLTQNRYIAVGCRPKGAALPKKPSISLCLNIASLGTEALDCPFFHCDMPRHDLYPSKDAVR